MGSTGCVVPEPVFAGCVVVPCAGVGASVDEGAEVDGVPQELQPLVVLVYVGPHDVPHGLQEVAQEFVHTGV